MKSRFCLFLVVVLASVVAHAAEIGAVVIHGKWGNPGGNMTPLVNALRDAGFDVSAPEMPWSGRRLYDQPVESAVSQVDAEVAGLRARGAKHVFIVGQSLGAAFAAHYAVRGAVSGIVAIAPGHRAETKRYVELFGDTVRTARELVAAGKPQELVGYDDLNTGDRRRYIRTTAAAFLSYYDPNGPLNMTRNVAQVKPETPVLWLVPTREDPRARPAVVALFEKLPKHAHTRFGEPDADHLGAPAASARTAIDWMREVAAKN